MLLGQPGQQVANGTVKILRSKVNQVAALARTLIVPDIEQTIYFK